MIGVSLFKDGQCIEHNVSWESFIQKYHYHSYMFWIDVNQADDREWEVLNAFFSFNDLTLINSKHYTEYPLIEEFDDYLFIATHLLLIGQDGDLIKKELDMVVGDNFIITSHRSDLASIQRVNKKICNSGRGLKKGPSMILYYILEDHINTFAPIIKAFDDQIEALEERIILGDTEGVLDEIISKRKYSTRLKRMVSPLCDQYKQLAYPHRNFIAKEVSGALDLLEDRAFELKETIQLLRESLSSVQDSYLTVVSHKMNEITFTMNGIMQKLTLVSTIFLPLTFITGWYGMNFKNMPELEWNWGYPLIIFVTFVVTLGLVQLFRKNKWLD